jgi:hypothetical protein
MHVKVQAQLFATLVITTLLIACGGGGGGSGDTSESETPVASGSTPAGGSTPAATTTGSGRIQQTGLVNNWNPTSQSDPSRVFATSFKATDDQIDVAFRLSEGPAVDVTAEWKLDGTWLILPGALKTRAEGGKWASFTFTPQGSHFNSGEYEVTLGISGTTEKKPLKFRIAPESTGAKFNQAGLVKVWNESTRPDPSTFTTSFLPTDRTVYAAFTLASGSPGEVRATWKYAGRELIFGNPPVVQVQGGGSGAHHLTTEQLPAGDYEATLAVAGTSETRPLRFSVASNAPADATRFEGATGLTNRLDTSVEPNPSTFTTSFSTTDRRIYALFKLTGGTDALTWVTAVWKYNGSPFYDGSDSIVVKGDGWWHSLLDLGTTPVGDYEVILTVLRTGESKSLKFSVR